MSNETSASARQELAVPRESYKELLKSELFLLSIVENIPYMIFLKDAEQLRFVRINRAGEELLGYRREELIGKNDYDFFPLDQADFFTEKDREVLRLGTPVDIPEEPIQTHRGTRILHTKKIPVIDETGTPRYLLGISEDVTEKKAMEAQLQQMQKMEAIGRLAGGIAHDFNNLLMGIVGCCDVVLDKLGPNSPLRVYLEEMKAASVKGGSLTRQLLTFTQNHPKEKRNVRLSTIIGSNQMMLRSLLPENIRLEFALNPESDWISAEPGQIEQVLMNLVVNARDSMPEGGELRVDTDVTMLSAAQVPSGLRARKYVVLGVRDTGTGMTQEQVSRAFEPFYTTKAPDKGTGLGLTVAYAVARNNGGFIDIASRIGDGTTVSVYWPSARAVSESTRSWAVDRAEKQATVLVVEDERLVRLAVRRYLEKSGYQVLEASDARQAVDLCHSNQVHLLVTDMSMAGIDGLQLSKRVQRISSSTRVIFMSGYIQSDQWQRLQDRGAILLNKPFSERELVIAVRQALNS